MSYQSVFRPGLFAGQAILVTGGGSGLGRCMAHELVARGLDRGRQPVHGLPRGPAGVA